MRGQARWAAVAALLVAGSGQLAGQSAASQFTVRATHPQARFRVDGRTYTGAATFLWTEGSAHVLEFFLTDGGYQYSTGGRTRFRFGGWSDSAGLLKNGAELVQVVVPHPDVSAYTLTVAAEYDVFIQLYDPGGDAPAVCPPPGPRAPDDLRPGVVCVDGVCLCQSAHLWLEEGPHALNAFPYPGFAFTGWMISTGGTSAFLRELVVTSPLEVTPRFAPAKRVSFRTEPPGLTVLLDRTPTPTPSEEPCHQLQPLPVAAPAGLPALCVGEVDWALWSRHTIGAETPQTDRTGKLWVFDGFSNGAANHSPYEVHSLEPERIVARFVPGARVSFLTEPAGLKLSINGRDNWPSYNFVAKAGETFEISAPGVQTGPDGRRYVFRGWSNGGEAAQRVTVPPEAIGAGLRLTARYERLSQVVVHSDPAGTAIEVDGAPCDTPCAIDRAAGTDVRVSAPELRPISHAQRLVFEGWSDGGPRVRTLRLSGSERVDLTARYRTEYLLETAAQPAGGATFELEPPSPDGFYPLGTYVTVTAKARDGYRFRRWAGDLEGTYPSAGLSMAVPRQAIALLDEVPYIAPAGVRNAAGDTPDAVVAPCSIVSIYGAGLANWAESGPQAPLAQTLGGATVRTGGRLLALFYASPEQINAWLPCDLPEGNHTLTVSRTGGPDVTGEFTAARNAPGLFSRLIDNRAYALATHEDGTPVLAASPARRGELVSIYATGLGPYDRMPPYGFPLPGAPPYQLTDPVEVLAGDLPVRHEFAGGAPGFSGADVIRLRITDELPRAATVELRVRVSGRESNRVLLPLE